MSSTYAVVGSSGSARLAGFVAELGAALERAGLDGTQDGEVPGFVLNVIDAAAPVPFRRGSRGTYVAAIHESADLPEGDPLETTYPLLVRALANVVLSFVPGRGVWFTTMERGWYGVTGNDDASLARAAVERLLPLARARLVIDNEFRPDLEPELRNGDEHTEEIREVGVRLGELGLLPAPFPLEELLGDGELRAVKRLFGIGGLSYGNLSARKDERRFWMSASGVDKTRLDVPGRDVLLVSGYDEEKGAMILSVSPAVEPRRVSVDAIEHWMIYRRHPEVGAILHVHAWVDGISATEVNYPCGSEDLAVAVSDLIAADPDPAHAVVGLRNHGITATGESLTEILDRIGPRILPQVPMQ